MLVYTSKQITQFNTVLGLNFKLTEEQTERQKTFKFRGIPVERGSNNSITKHFYAQIE